MRRLGLVLGITGAAVAGAVVVRTLYTRETHTALDRFSGGSSDGYARAAFLQSEPVIIPPSPRFSGGAEDGHSHAWNLVNEPVLPQTSARFHGGAFDGYSAAILGVLPWAPSIPAPARFSGGRQDGYGVLIVSAMNGHEVGEAFRRYAGGPMDGHGVALLKQSDHPVHVAGMRFWGGAYDGSAFDLFLASGDPYAHLSPRFFGGPGDGFDAELIRIPIAMILVDTDGDGIPDWWEVHYFGGPTNAIADQDFDGSGMTNLEEYIAGTDPRKRDSVFRIDRADPLESGDGTSRITLSWDTANGRLYKVYVSTDLSGAWPEEPEAEIVGFGQTATYTHEILTTEPLFFMLTVEFW